MPITQTNPTLIQGSEGKNDPVEIEVVPVKSPDYSYNPEKDFSKNISKKTAEMVNKGWSLVSVNIVNEYSRQGTGAPSAYLMFSR